MRRALLEVWITAQAALLNVGPKQYCVALVPKFPTSLDADKKRWNEKVDELRKNDFTGMAGDTLHSIIYVAEAYDRDCNDPTLLKTSPEFWDALAKMTVHAAKMGFVHGDMKPHNTVYRKNPDGKTYTCKLIDLDPGFVVLLDMANVENVRLAPCLALLTLCAFLGFVRCRYRFIWERADTERVILMARTAFQNAIAAEYGDNWNQYLSREVGEERLQAAFNVMCTHLNLDSTKEVTMVLKSTSPNLKMSWHTIVRAMFHNFTQYVQPECAFQDKVLQNPTVRNLIEYGLNLKLTQKKQESPPPAARPAVPAAPAPAAPAPAAAAARRRRDAEPGSAPNQPYRKRRA